MSLVLHVFGLASFLGTIPIYSTTRRCGIIGVKSMPDGTKGTTPHSNGCLSHQKPSLAEVLACPRQLQPRRVFVTSISKTYDTSISNTQGTLVFVIQMRRV